MMNTLKPGDLVSWKYGRKTLYGRIQSISAGYATIAQYGSDDWGEEYYVPLKDLNYEPPVVLSTEDLRKFARLEIRYADLKQHRTFADLEIPEPYQIVPEDLKEAVINFRRYGMGEDTFGAEYVESLWNEMYDGVGMETALNGPQEDEDRPVPNQYTVFSAAWGILIDKYRYSADDADLDDIITEIQTWEDNKEKPYAQREYTPAQKRAFLTHWSDDRLKEADEDIRAAYRKILDSLCEQDDTEALRTKAYACYGDGNAAYGQNWPESLKCLLRLMELDPNPQTANTLGYMYYYGRCTDGVPEYDKAFYYFSIGAAGGYYESRYKLSDMFRHGYGVGKNPEAAAALIWEVYEDQLKMFRDGNFHSDFADVALRAGNIYKEGINCSPSPNQALYFYLQARYAIRMRMLATDFFGDQKVASGIDQAIEEILPKTRYEKPENTAHFDSMLFLLQNGLGRKHRMEMKIRKTSDTDATLTFRIVPYEDGAFVPKLFVTVPSAHFCGLLEKVTVRAKNIKWFRVPEGGDTVLFDSIEGDEFYLYGKPVAEIDADYVFSAQQHRGKKRSYVSVTFSPGGRRYDYLCDFSIGVGEKAVVETPNGEATVTVVAVFEKTDSELSLPLKRYKKVLRAGTLE